MKVFTTALGIMMAGSLLAAGLFQEGLIQRSQGHFEESILSFQQLLKESPDNAQGWYELGLTYATDSQYAKACDAYRLALSHGFTQPQCHCALALALRETHHSAAALGEAKRCLELMPYYAGAYNLIGNAEIDLGEDEAALRAYQHAVQIKPGYANARFNLALTYAALGRQRESELAFLETIKLQPSMADAWGGLGDCQLREFQPNLAVKSFAQALKLNPAGADFEWGLARAWRALGNNEKAQAHESAYRRLLRAADNRSYFKVTDQSQRRSAAEGTEAWDKETREDH